MRLLYWIKNGLIAAGTVLLASVIFILITNFQIDEELSIENVLHSASLYVILMGGLMDIVFSFNIYNTYLPLTLSFGSTRREAMAGIGSFRLVYTAVILIVLTAACALAGFAELPALCMAGLGVFLCLHGLGVLIGWAGVRFGKTAQTVIILCITVLCVAVPIIAIFSIKSGITITTDLPAHLPVLVLGIGAVFYALMMIPERWTVTRYTVKL